MRVEKDFEELLKLFNKHKIKYCIIGAFALAFHAQPRYTKDMDIIVEPTVENGKKIVTALAEFGFESLKLSPEEFCQPDRFIQLGYEPVRVDLITSIEGLLFQKIWKNRKIGTYGKARVFFIGLDDLIQSKEIAGRKQDVADLDRLKAIKNRKLS